MSVLSLVNLCENVRFTRKVRGRSDQVMRALEAVKADALRNSYHDVRQQRVPSNLIRPRSAKADTRKRGSKYAEVAS